MRRYRDESPGGKRVEVKKHQLNAAYGLFFNASETAKPVYKYVELLHPKGFDPDTTIYTERIDFGAAHRFYVVQTYDRELSEIAKTFEDGRFTGDFTVNLLGSNAVYLKDFSAKPSGAVTVELRIDDRRGMVLRFSEASGARLYEKEIFNYVRGYNPYSPAVAHSLWPFMEIKDENDEK